jgi:hypothetical protein
LPAPPAPPPTLELARQTDSDIKRVRFEDAAAAAAAAATEHSEETTNLPSEKRLIYSIVNAFLNKITFHHPQAEELLVAALNDETCLPHSMHTRVEEVFTPIFIHYPKGLKDRSVWEPRDTNQYIRQWYKLDSMRQWVTLDAAATEHGNELSKVQVSQIFKRYMEDMLDTAIASDSQILYEPWYPCPGCIGRMPRHAMANAEACLDICLGIPRHMPMHASAYAMPACMCICLGILRHTPLHASAYA